MFSSLTLRILLFVLLALAVEMCPAVGVVKTHGEFIATAPCPAPLRLQQINPDEILLEPGRAYRTLGLNQRGGDWVRIIAPEARPRVRWVDLDCGEYRVDEGTLRFAPFFDERNTAVYVDYPKRTRQDITPPPPTVSPLEERILALCGYPGDYPEPGAFRSLIEATPILMEKITKAFNCHARKPDCGREEILDRVTDLWFLVDGFRHVFCGEPGPKRMDGLHYRAAYLQLQHRGWGGLMAPHKGREEIVPDTIYSIGIEHEWRGQRVKTPVTPGYFYTLDGADLLMHGTRAITLLGAPISRQACRYTITNPSNTPETDITFHSVIIGKDGGLKTFYPTALADRTLQSCE